MKNFSILASVLCIILLIISLLLDKMMGIFMVSVLVCIFYDAQKKDKKHIESDDDKKA